MGIKAIWVCSRHMIEGFIKGEYPLPMGKVALISIYSGTSYSPFLMSDDNIKKLGLNLVDCLSLEFEDATEEDLKWLKPDERKKVLFQPEQAVEVIKFVERNKDKVDYFIAHCDAGISRSGAVGEFICDMTSFDYKAFMLANTGIRPNPYVRMVLKRAWRKMMEDSTK